MKIFHELFFRIYIVGIVLNIIVSYDCTCVKRLREV